MSKSTPEIGTHIKNYSAWKKHTHTHQWDINMRAWDINMLGSQGPATLKETDTSHGSFFFCIIQNQQPGVLLTATHNANKETGTKITRPLSAPKTQDGVGFFIFAFCQLVLFWATRWNYDKKHAHVYGLYLVWLSRCEDLVKLKPNSRWSLKPVMRLIDSLHSEGRRICLPVWNGNRTNGKLCRMSGWRCGLAAYEGLRFVISWMDVQNCARV